MGMPSAGRPDIANAASNLIAKAWVTASPSAIGSNRSVCQGKDSWSEAIVWPLLLVTVSALRVHSRNATPATLANLRPPAHGVAP